MAPDLEQPIPTNLRQQLIGLISEAPDDELPELHRRLMLAERDRLWRRVQSEAQRDSERGAYQDVAEMIRERRSRGKAS